MSQWHLENVCCDSFESSVSWAVDIESLFIDGLIHKFIDDWLRNSLGLSHQLLLKEDLLPIKFALFIMGEHLIILVLSIFTLRFFNFLAVFETALLSINIDWFQFTTIFLRCNFTFSARFNITLVLTTNSGAITNIFFNQASFRATLNLIIEYFLRLFAMENRLTLDSRSIMLDGNSSIQVVISLFDWMIILDEFVHWDHAMLISFNLFVDMESLELSQDLNDSLLESGSDHQWSIVWCSKSFFSDLDSMNWLHSVSNLVVLTSHKLTSWSSTLVH